MNNLNSILIEGNLVRDAEIRNTPKGTAVCNFQIASNCYFKQDAGMEKEVSFLNVETWAKLAEGVGNLEIDTPELFSMGSFPANAIKKYQQEVLALIGTAADKVIAENWSS
jgi:hypothetical protein